jgi:hypothetical protein
MKSAFASSIAIVLIAFTEPTKLPDGARYEVSGGKAFGKTYDSSFTEKMFRKTPVWEEGAANPPVSAGKAIALATKMKDSLVKDSDGFTWQLMYLELQPMDGGRWFWGVMFEAIPENGPGRQIHTLCVVALMDGTVVKPRVIANEPRPVWQEVP